jgi:3-phenylpropionate/trans-cinnamate dioxygenase ferredoxin component
MTWHLTKRIFSEMDSKVIYTEVVLDQKVVILKDGDAVYALEDRCSHDNAEFDGGQVLEGNIECPRHGACFDYKSGKATGMPAVEGIQSYPAEVREDKVYIDL